MNAYTIDFDTIKIAGTVIGGAIVLASGVGTYVANRVSMSKDIRHLRDTVANMEDDVDGKVDEGVCHDTRERFQADLTQIRTTTDDTRDIVIRLEALAKAPKA